MINSAVPKKSEKKKKKVLHVLHESLAKGTSLINDSMPQTRCVCTNLIVRKKILL